MPKIVFLPEGKQIEVPPSMKILAGAIRNKINIRYSCGACQCGSCGIAVKVEGEVSPMEEEERKMLISLGLVTDGTVRMACRTKVLAGTVTVDLDFQQTYSPEHRTID